MLSVLKQSGAKATDSFKKHFNRSIIRLTFLYAGTLAIILLISGLVLYSAFSSRIGRRFNIPTPPPGTTQVIILKQPTAQEVREDLIASLILVNGLLLIIAGISSYWLAKFTLQPIKDSYERQQRFLGDASHELRTPLSILQIELENELRSSRSSLHTDELKSKLEEVQRMSKIVNDLLTLSRLDAETTSSKNINRVALNKTISEIINRIQPLATSHNISLIFKPSDNPILMSLDEELFSHALTNLIQNAIIYNKPNGYVTITTKKENKECVISVIDTGMGISPEDLQNIFERFYRTDKSRSRKTGGTGLGLSIAYSAIDHMNGSVEIESEVGQSTTVIVRLPLG